MGRIDLAPGRPTRPPIPLAGWIVAAGLAAVLVALLAFQAGKRSVPDRGAPAVVSPAATAAQTPQPAAAEPEQPAPTPSLQSAVMEVKLPPRPTAPEAVSAPTVGPSPVPAETLHDQMARCLSFRAEEDEIHDGSNPIATRVLVIVTNGCDSSFVGPDVWFEARAVPKHPGGGTSAREVGRFQNPIEARSGSETAIVLACPRCYAVTHRLEASLWWAAGDRRKE